MKTRKKSCTRRKTIVLFAWKYQIGPLGGSLDCEGTFETVEAAKRAFSKGGFHFGNIATIDDSELKLIERYYNGSVGWLKADG
jgi:hypothetical protein